MKEEKERHRRANPNEKSNFEEYKMMVCFFCNDDLYTCPIYHAHADAVHPDCIEDPYTSKDRNRIRSHYHVKKAHEWKWKWNDSIASPREP